MPLKLIAKADSVNQYVKKVKGVISYNLKNMGVSFFPLTVEEVSHDMKLIYYLQSHFLVSRGPDYTGVSRLIH